MLRVLVALDFSDISLPVLDAGIQVAERAAPASVTVMTVVPHSDDTDMHRFADIEKRVDQLRELVEVYLGERRLHAGVTLRYHAVHGAPAEEIAAQATASHADVVVVGTHGRRGLDRLLLGSVAETVVRVSPCSVLVVKPRKH